MRVECFGLHWKIPTLCSSLKTTLYNMEGKLPDDAGALDIDHAVIRRPGNDVTLIAYGAGLFKAMEAAEQLAMEGIQAEVIDLRSLRPLDHDTFLASISRTHRAVIVDEGWRSGGISAEISARIMEGAFYDLDGPVERICGIEVPMPYAKHLEEAALPQIGNIISTVKTMVQSNG
jgi:pyruvate/2-oxoglutarate/acetoin dehydrogenase E1 component